MPGMMDTILNPGLNDEALAGLIEQTGDERFACEVYPRLIPLFGKVALGIADEKFDPLFEDVKKHAGVKADVGLNVDHLKETFAEFPRCAGVSGGKGNDTDPDEEAARRLSL
jgi:pyruvate,orthophosphate dikinase